MSPSRPRQPHDHVVFTDLDGVEGVLVDLNTKQYFQLNETACLVWRGLAKGTPLAEIADEMTGKYDVPPDKARSSVEAILEQFVTHQLVSPPAP